MWRKSLGICCSWADDVTSHLNDKYNVNHSCLEDQIFALPACVKWASRSICMGDKCWRKMTKYLTFTRYTTVFEFHLIFWHAPQAVYILTYFLRVSNDHIREVEYQGAVICCMNLFVVSLKNANLSRKIIRCCFDLNDYGIPVSANPWSTLIESLLVVNHF